jgi:predicted ATP-dependent protease
MSLLSPLPPSMLLRRSNPSLFTEESTESLPSLLSSLGQERATESLQFGFGMKRKGYNIFALGPQGLGKRTMIQNILKEQTDSEQELLDWCYVNNFDEPRKPRALSLPAGQGAQLRSDMDALIEDAGHALSNAFESEEYQVQKQFVEDELKEEREREFDELHSKAEEYGLVLLRTPMGFVFAPTRDGEVLSPDKFETLTSEEQDIFEKHGDELQQGLKKLMHKMPGWERQKLERLKQLNVEIALFALKPFFEELELKYAKQNNVLLFLTSVQKHLLEQVKGMTTEEKNPITLAAYRVNLLVDHSGSNQPPIVELNHPSYSELNGRIERVAQMGALVTDFSLIRPGALHRANGGTLLVEARKLLLQPFSWEALKRTLKTQQIRIESPESMMSMGSTNTLEPEPIPLELKVVLVGDRMLYYLLCQYDPEFQGLFKVAADFGDHLERSDESEKLYARLLNTLVQEEELRPLTPEAIARVIEHSARMVGGSGKLSAAVGSVRDLLCESDYWASQSKQDEIRKVDVQLAIDAQIRRSDRLREQIQETMLRETLMVHTTGEAVGQINGLSVLQLGNFAFGRPSRITARVRLGQGEVVDIEREVKLGGPLHTKGVLILSSLLASEFAEERPLSLRASLVFEQSYGGIDGDSASSAELYALLSAIAKVPIRQELAVTGSINQMGEIQPIGGVNEKIEGFFDLCKARGLTGNQGVLIPVQNVQNLMLRQDVVEAAEAGDFHVYAVSHFREGIELLTGIPAGERDEDGGFPEGSISARVMKRLDELTNAIKAFRVDNKDNTIVKETEPASDNVPRSPIPEPDPTPEDPV